MSNSTTTYINGIQTLNTVLDCTKTHRLNTYFSPTALMSQSAYDEEDLDSQYKNHDISYIPNCDNCTTASCLGGPRFRPQHEECHVDFHLLYCSSASKGK